MNPEAHNTGQEIKRHFYEAKRQQLNKPYSPAARQKRPEFWESAGQLCVDLKAAPFDFVKAAFMFNNVPGGPYPNQMGGGAARRWYNQYRQLVATGDATGTDVVDQEVKDVFAHALRISMHQTQHSPVDMLLSEYYVRPEVVPAFVRVLLYRKSAAMLERWGRRASNELKSNPRILDAVHRLGYDTTSLDQYE